MSRFLTLNIGASKAVLAEYALKGKNALTLTGYGEADLTAAGDATGALDAVLSPALAALMREKGIKPAPLVVSLNAQTVFLRPAKFPPVSGDKLDELVRYEIEQNVPFASDEIVSDHQFTGETPEGDKAAMIAAAKIEQVRSVTDAVAGAGLSPVIVDVSPMAVYNAFCFANPKATGCSVILDVGAKTTSLILVEGEKIYTRSIPVAGNTITREIAQAFGCTQEEAEQLKRERGYVSLGGVTEDEDEVSDRVAKIIRTVLTRLHAEISRSINFYRSQQGGNAPERLYLTGGTVRLPQFDEFFHESLQVEVAYLNPFQRIAVGGRVNRNALANDAFTLAESAGLALRMTDLATMKINLMPPELVEHARNVKRIPFVVLGAVAFLAALGVGVFIENGRAERVKEEVTCVEEANGRLGKLEQGLKKAQAQMAGELEACDEFQKLLMSRSDALRRVKAVRKSLLPGMWLTEWKPLKDVDGARIVIRGWKDQLSAIEARRSQKKRATAAELVQAELIKQKVVVPDTVKIVAQKDVKNCMSEFALEMTVAPAAAACPEEAKAGKKKGAR